MSKKKETPGAKRKAKRLNVVRVAAAQQKPRTLTLADLTNVTGGNMSGCSACSKKIQ